MNKHRNKLMLVTMLCGVLYLIFVPTVARAATTPSYTVDYGPRTLPTFSGYTQVIVNNQRELSNSLNSSTAQNIEIVLSQNITITTGITINGGAANGGKILNLNNHELTGTNSSYLFVSSSSRITNFKITNGSINAGRNTLAIGGDNEDNSSTSGFFLVSPKKKINFVAENLSYRADNSGNIDRHGGFFKGLSSNVFVTGTTSITSGTYNFRAGNMSFINANFEGLTTDVGDPGDRARSNGGNNLTFVGYNDITLYRSYLLDGGTVSTQYQGDRRIFIDNKSQVKLVNLNTGNSKYANNIGNFATLTVEGKLDATAVGTSLRTTASSNLGTSTYYNNYPGTYNGQANINVQPGSDFNATSTDTRATNGVLYTYSTDLNVNSPNSFNMIYNGRGSFFFAYQKGNNSNFRLYNLSFAVWDKAKQGLGSFDNFWKDVPYFELLNFYRGKYPIINAPSNQPGLANFNIDEYSRISDDIGVPAILLDVPYQQGLPNTSNLLVGSTNYFIPDKNGSGAIVDTQNYLNKPAVNALVTLKIGTDTYTTRTNSSGRWSFNNIKTTPPYKGGTVATLKLDTTDYRVSPTVNLPILDKIPPVATPKLIKQVQGTELTNPKDGINTYSDDTSASDKLTFSFKNTPAELKKMTDTLGVYTIKIEVKDEAGNSTIVDSPLIVYPKGETITDGYIVGDKVNVIYSEWENADTANKRQMMIDEGLKAYTISGNTVTDVTNDSNVFQILIPTQSWIPGASYDLTTKVNSYTKKVRVTLNTEEVNMKIKQVYQNTQNPIYSNYLTSTLVDNSISESVTVGDSIEDILNDLITKKKLTLNYPGYQSIVLTDYSVVINNQPSAETISSVPEEDFDVIFEYEGELNLEVPSIDFGKIAIGKNETPYTSNENVIAITNTKLEDHWILKASMPEGILSSEGSDPFKGELIYRVGDKNIILNDVSTVIAEQVYATKPLPYEQVELGNSSKGQMILNQYYGNYQEDYDGTIVWSLEDTVTSKVAD